MVMPAGNVATATANVTTAATVAGRVGDGRETGRIDSDGFVGGFVSDNYLSGPALDYGPLKLISVDFFSPHLYFIFWLQKKNRNSDTKK